MRDDCEGPKVSALVVNCFTGQRVDRPQLPRVFGAVACGILTIDDLLDRKEAVQQRSSRHVAQKMVAARHRIDDTGQPEVPDQIVGKRWKLLFGIGVTIAVHEIRVHDAACSMSRFVNAG